MQNTSAAIPEFWIEPIYKFRDFAADLIVREAYTIMASFFSRFSFFRLAGAKKAASRLRERDVIFYAMLGVVVLLVVVLVLDGYLFFVVAGRTYAPPPSVPFGILLSDKEIDEVIRLLDARAQKFNAIMGTGGNATNAEK